jgi:hypothetical protein
MLPPIPSCHVPGRAGHNIGPGQAKQSARQCPNKHRPFETLLDADLNECSENVTSSLIKICIIIEINFVIKAKMQKISK